MAYGDSGGGGSILWDLIGIGFLGLGVYSAYVYKDEILAWLNGGNGNGGCTLHCSAGQHLVIPGGNASNCTCVPDTCTKTCPTGQHVTSSCTCVANTICGGKTCGSGTHLNTGTCNCDSDGGGAGGNIAFTAAGDWGSGRNSNWKATVATMKGLHPNAVVIPGDLAYSGGAAKFKPVTDAIHAFPEHPKILGAMGNHDGSADAANFDYFSNRVVTIGNTSFMLLDTDNGSGSVSFAKANMNKMTAKWKVVAFHKPIYTMKSNHGADEGGIKALVPEFEKGHINLVVQAHNHNYQRFAPKNFVTYIVVGTGGESHYSLSGGGTVKSDASHYGTFFANCTNSAMQCKFVATGGAVIDSFTI